jgi:hypothetical protein
LGDICGAVDLHVQVKQPVAPRHRTRSVRTHFCAWQIR